MRVRKRWGMGCSTGVKSDQGVQPFLRLLIGFQSVSTFAWARDIFIYESFGD